MIMNAEGWMVVASWAGPVVMVATLFLREKRNGRKDVAKETEMKTELTNAVSTINKRLDDKDNGLHAIKGAVDAQKLHCAEVSSKISEQVKANRRDIDKNQQDIDKLQNGRRKK
jgi:hypothetical protein